MIENHSKWKNFQCSQGFFWGDICELIVSNVNTSRDPTPMHLQIRAFRYRHFFKVKKNDAASIPIAVFFGLEKRTLEH